MEYIKSLSVVQKLALIAGPLILLNSSFFLDWDTDLLYDWNHPDAVVWFCSIGVCVAAYFLFPKKQKTE